MMMMTTTTSDLEITSTSSSNNNNTIINTKKHNNNISKIMVPSLSKVQEIVVDHVYSNGSLPLPMFSSSSIVTAGRTKLNNTINNPTGDTNLTNCNASSKTTNVTPAVSNLCDMYANTVPSSSTSISNKKKKKKKKKPKKKNGNHPNDEATSSTPPSEDDILSQIEIEEMAKLLDQFMPGEIKMEEYQRLEIAKTTRDTIIEALRSKKANNMRIAYEALQAATTGGASAATGIANKKNISDSKTTHVANNNHNSMDVQFVSGGHQNVHHSHSVGNTHNHTNAILVQKSSKLIAGYTSMNNNNNNSMINYQQHYQHNHHHYDSNNHHRIQDNDDIWYINDHEERQRIREFWMKLSEKERRELVRLEKETLLRKIKEHQRQTCTCEGCGRKRSAIEDELEMLFDAYYKELECFTNDKMRALMIGPDAANILSATNCTSSNNNNNNKSDDDAASNCGGMMEHKDTPCTKNSNNTAEHHTSNNPSKISGIHPAMYHQERDGTGSFIYEFGSSLTAKGGILSVADDFLSNDGKKFLDLMEQLAERKLRHLNNDGEDGNSYTDEEYYDEDEEEDDEDEEEAILLEEGDWGGPYEHQSEEDEDYEYNDYESEEEEEDDDNEDYGASIEQRMEEGRRMFQIFAAKMFEQRVMNAYREKMAYERQQRLLAELEEEERLEQEREQNRLRKQERKKAQKKLHQQMKEEERLQKEREKKEHEEKIRLEKQKKVEEERLKREQQKQKELEALMLKEEEERKVLEEKKLAMEREMKKAEEKKRLEKEKKEREERLRQEKEVKKAAKKSSAILERKVSKVQIEKKSSANNIGNSGFEDTHGFGSSKGHGSSIHSSSMTTATITTNSHHPDSGKNSPRLREIQVSIVEKSKILKTPVKEIQSVVISRSSQSKQQSPERSGSSTPSKLSENGLEVSVKKRVHNNVQTKDEAAISSSKISITDHVSTSLIAKITTSTKVSEESHEAVKTSSAETSTRVSQPMNYPPGLSLYVGKASTVKPAPCLTTGLGNLPGALSQSVDSLTGYLGETTLAESNSMLPRGKLQDGTSPKIASGMNTSGNPLTSTTHSSPVTKRSNAAFGLTPSVSAFFHGNPVTNASWAVNSAIPIPILNNSTNGNSKVGIDLLSFPLNSPKMSSPSLFNGNTSSLNNNNSSQSSAGKAAPGFRDPRYAPLGSFNSTSYSMNSGNTNAATTAPISVATAAATLGNPLTSLFGMETAKSFGYSSGSPDKLGTSPSPIGPPGKLSNNSISHSSSLVFKKESFLSSVGGTSTPSLTNDPFSLDFSRTNSLSSCSSIGNMRGTVSGLNMAAAGNKSSSTLTASLPAASVSPTNTTTAVGGHQTNLPGTQRNHLSEQSQQQPSAEHNIWHSQLLTTLTAIPSDSALDEAYSNFLLNDGIGVANNDKVFSQTPDGILGGVANAFGLGSSSLVGTLASNNMVNSAGLSANSHGNTLTHGMGSSIGNSNEGGAGSLGSRGGSTQPVIPNLWDSPLSSCKQTSSVPSPSLKQESSSAKLTMKPTTSSRHLTTGLSKDHLWL